MTFFKHNQRLSKSRRELCANHYLIYKKPQLLYFLLIIFFHLTAINSTPISSPKDLLPSPKLTPCKGGRFRYNLAQAPHTLNPYHSDNYHFEEIRRYVVETLIEKDIRTNTWKPRLAKLVSTSKDKKSFVFELRKGVSWHDGTPITVQDIKFSFESIFNPLYEAHRLKAQFGRFESVEILSTNQVRFKAKNSFFKNLDILASLYILPKSIYEKKSQEEIRQLSSTLIGSGPYQIESHQQDYKITLKRNPNWWGQKTSEYQDRYNFDYIELTFIEDSNVVLEKLKKGDIDYKGLKAEEFQLKIQGQSWSKNLHKVKATNKTPRPYRFIALNLLHPLFKDKKIRMAMAHMINWPLMIQKLLFDLYRPTIGPWDATGPFADPSLRAYEYNLQKSAQLLRESGLSLEANEKVLSKVVDGQKIKFEFTLITYEKCMLKFLNIIKEDAKKIGINIQLKYVEWGMFLQLIHEKKFDAVTAGWADEKDIDPAPLWQSTNQQRNGQNFINYANPEVDLLINKLSLTPSPSLKQEIIKKIYRHIVLDVGYLFLFTGKYYLYAVSKNIARPCDSYIHEIGIEYWWIPSLETKCL